MVQNIGGCAHIYDPDAHIYALRPMVSGWRNPNLEP